MTFLPDPIVAVSDDCVVVVMDHYAAKFLAQRLSEVHAVLGIELGTEDDMFMALSRQITDAIAATKATVVVPFKGTTK